jgi:hypothetical protein
MGLLRPVSSPPEMHNLAKYLVSRVARCCGRHILFIRFQARSGVKKYQRSAWCFENRAGNRAWLPSHKRRVNMPLVEPDSCNVTVPDRCVGN